MTVETATRALDVDLLARELGNWRTSSRSGPAYQGLSDAIRLLIVDGRVPVGARLPSERALADALRVSRAPVTANLAAATLAGPAAALSQAFTEAAEEVTPYLHDIGIELTGVLTLRAAIAQSYCARGLPTEPDEIMVTTGALHAIGLIMATYTQPGDRVLVEQPTYHGALSAMSTRGLRPV